MMLSVMVIIGRGFPVTSEPVAVMAIPVVFVVLNPVSFTDVANNQSCGGVLREVGLDRITLSDINVTVVVQIFARVKGLHCY